VTEKKLSDRTVWKACFNLEFGEVFLAAWMGGVYRQWRTKTRGVGIY